MTDLVTKAREFAYKAHEGQTRKGKTTPFTDHLDTVYEIAKGLTQYEELLAAAWLHDVVEDTDVSLEEIYSTFGPTVGRYVEIESEDKMTSISERASWKSRKDEQIARLSALQGDDKLVYIVTLSDKLANLREIREEYKLIGDELWEKFNNNDKSAHEWYYTSMHEITKGLSGLDNTKESCEMSFILKEIFG